MTPIVPSSERQMVIQPKTSTKRAALGEGDLGGGVHMAWLQPAAVSYLEMHDVRLHNVCSR